MRVTANTNEDYYIGHPVHFQMILGNFLHQQDQDCDCERAKGRVRVGAQEGLQTHHQDGSSTPVCQGVCGCSQGSLCHLQSEPKEETISNSSEVVLQS